MHPPARGQFQARPPHVWHGVFLVKELRASCSAAPCHGRPRGLTGVAGIATHTHEARAQQEPLHANKSGNSDPRLSKMVKSRPRALAARMPGLSVSAPCRPRAARRRARDGQHGEHGDGQGAAGGRLRLHTRGGGVPAVGRCSQSRPPAPRRAQRTEPEAQRPAGSLTLAARLPCG